MHSICCVKPSRSAKARLRWLFLHLLYLSAFSYSKRVFRGALKIKRRSRIHQSPERCRPLWQRGYGGDRVSLRSNKASEAKLYGLSAVVSFGTDRRNYYRALLKNLLRKNGFLEMPYQYFIDAIIKSPLCGGFFVSAVRIKRKKQSQQALLKNRQTKINMCRTKERRQQNECK